VALTKAAEGCLVRVENGSPRTLDFCPNRGTNVGGGVVPMDSEATGGEAVGSEETGSIPVGSVLLLEKVGSGKASEVVRKTMSSCKNLEEEVSGAVKRNTTGGAEPQRRLKLSRVGAHVSEEVILFLCPLGFCEEKSFVFSTPRNYATTILRQAWQKPNDLSTGLRYVRDIALGFRRDNGS
jgi:hypothetical protein